MSVSKIEKVCARIFFLILFLVVAFIVLEKVSQHYLVDRVDGFCSVWDSPNLRDPKPYVVFGGKPFNSTHNLNDLGYTGKSPTQKKEEGEYRVFVLGGSTVFGQITRKLEATFAKEGIENVNVFNCGVVSSVSSMELARIVFEVLNYDPDLIILYSGGNDILDPYCERTRPGYPFNYVLYENNPLLSSRLDQRNWFMLLLFRSSLFRYVFQSYYIKEYLTESFEESTPPWMSEEWKEEVATIYVDNLYKAHTIADAFNVDLVSFFQPLIFYKNKHVGGELDVMSEWGEAKSYTLDIRERIMRKAASRLLSNAMSFHDLSTLFEKNEQEVFKDFIHVEFKGNRAITGAIYDVIKGSVIQKMHEKEL